MPNKRAQIVLPEQLLAEVDALVGQRGRSTFLTEVVGQEVQRRKLLAARARRRDRGRPNTIPNFSKARPPSSKNYAQRTSTA
jgi:hypothetical protein